MPHKYIYVMLIVGLAIIVAAILGSPFQNGRATQRLVMCAYLMASTVGIVVGIFGNRFIRPGALGLGIFGMLYFLFFEVFQGRSGYLGRSFGGSDFISEMMLSYGMLVMAGIVSQLAGMLFAPPPKDGKRKQPPPPPPRPPEPPCPLD